MGSLPRGRAGGLLRGGGPPKLKRMRRISGLLGLVHDTIDAVTTFVQDTQNASAQRTVRGIDALTPVGETGEFVERVRQGGRLGRSSTRFAPSIVWSSSRALRPSSWPRMPPSSSAQARSSARATLINHPAVYAVLKRVLDHVQPARVQAELDRLS